MSQMMAGEWTTLYFSVNYSTRHSQRSVILTHHDCRAARRQTAGCRTLCSCCKRVWGFADRRGRGVRRTRTLRRRGEGGTQDRSYPALIEMSCLAQLPASIRRARSEGAFEAAATRPGATLQGSVNPAPFTSCAAIRALVFIVSGSL